MVIVALLAANFFFAPIPLDQNPVQQNVMVRGAVVDASTGQSVAGAVVYAMSDADVETTVADSRGYFYFLKLIPGDYRISADAAGYRDECLRSGQDAQELNAGFEYSAIVALNSACR